MDALDDLCTHYSNYEKVVIVGDLNSSCVNTNIDLANKAKSNKLQCFVKQHSFYHTFKDVNIPFKGPEFTFTLTRTMLDYMLCHESHVRQVRRYEIFEEGSFSSTSDHLPAIATVYVEENPHIEMNSYLKLPSWHNITDDLIAKYNDELDEPLTNVKLRLKDSDTDIVIFHKNFANILLSTANEVFPKTCYNPHTKPYWNSGVKSAHTKERTMCQIWVHDGRPRGMQCKSNSDYKRAKRDFRNIQQNAN